MEEVERRFITAAHTACLSGYTKSHRRCLLFNCMRRTIGAELGSHEDMSVKKEAEGLERLVRETSTAARTARR